MLLGPFGSDSGRYLRGMGDLHPAECPHEIRREVMRMWWRNLTFVHWPFEPAEVQAVLPDGLRVDTFDGAAWVGLIPFEMEVQLPGGIRIPREGVFPETNVRLYAIGPDGTPGVWFCSLEAGRLSAVTVARVSYGLPYFWADMDVAAAGPIWTYRSTRRWPGPRGVRSQLAARVGDPIEQTAFDRYLTARWGLFSTLGSRLLYAPISHDPWTLHRAELLHLDDDLVGAAGFAIPDVEPIVHWTPGVEVRVGLPIRAR